MACVNTAEAGILSSKLLWVCAIHRSRAFPSVSNHLCPAKPHLKFDMARTRTLSSECCWPSALTL